MKAEVPVGIFSLLAAAALTRMTFVGLDGNVCAANAKAAGTANADAGSGNMVPVAPLGVRLVIAGGAINAGAAVDSDASGYAVTHNAGVINGYALDAAGASGDIIRII
jgi:Uncharacterized conserved protein (DUF2190)